MKFNNKNNFIDWVADYNERKIDIWNLIWIVLFINACFFSTIILLKSYFRDTGLEMITIFYVELLIVSNLIIFVVFEYALLRLKKKKSRFFLRLGSVLILAYILFKIIIAYWKINHIELEDGFLYFSETFLKDYNRAFKKNINIQSGIYAEADGAWRFVFLIAIELLSLLSFVTHCIFLYAAMPLLVLVSIMYVGKSPDFLSISALIILLFIGGLKHKKGIITTNDSKKSYRYKAFSNIFTFVILCLSLLVSNMFFEKPGDMMLSASPAFIRLQKNLESKLKYKGAKKVARTNPEITNKKPEYSGAEIMTITLDKKPVSNIYLRNFCGAVYKDSKWVDINNAWKNFDCSENQKKIIENELYNSSLECNLAEKTGIKINYIANIGDYLAIPYGVNHKNSSDYKFESDFLAKYTGRKYKYSFEGINANIYGDEELISIYNNSRGNEELCWNDYLNYVNDKYNMSNTYISSVKNMAYGLQSVSDITYYYKCFYDKMPAFDYSSSDQLYGSECKINNYLVAKAVAGILQNGFTYSLELDEIEENTEPISYFLDNSRKGYCIHFATAGALILREMNIPCRYVSGYIAKADSFVYKNGKYQSTVSDKTAHAWVEVYIDKLGWIPVEMTPGYNDTSNRLPTNNEPTNTPTFSPEATSIPEATPTFTPVPTDTPAPEPTTEPGNTATPIITVTGGGDNHSQGNDSDASAPGDDTNKSGILRGFIYIISGAAGVALFAAIIIKLRKKYINYIIIEINSKRYRNAIKRINKRIYRRLLKKQGIKLRQMNDEKYLYMLVENFKSISEQQWGEYYSIVKKAVYSREKLDSKEAVFCYDIYKNMN